MKECCANCKHLWCMEDWTDYPCGQFHRKVCGLFASEKSVMALYGDLTADYSICECFSPIKIDEEVDT